MEFLKLKRKEEEQALESKFKGYMLNKFAEDDRIEQMKAEKRRMVELQHKREVEKLWQLRREEYLRSKEKEEEAKLKLKEEERIKNEIIEMERQRLIAEYGSNLKDHLPK